MFKNYPAHIQKFLAVLLIFSLLTPHLVIAAPFTFDNPAPALPTGDQPIDYSVPGLEEAGVASPRFDLGVRQNTQQSKAALDQERAQIAQSTNECKEQTKGLSAASSLQNVISRGIQQKLSSTISRAVNKNLQSLVQRQVGQVLPQIIERGLAQQLPSALSRQMRSSGASAPTPALLQQALKQILPQIIQQNLSGELKRVLGDSLKGKMDLEIQKMLWTTTDEDGQPLPPEEYHSPILQNDALFQQKLLLTFGPESEMVKMLGPEAMQQIFNQIVQANVDAAIDSGQVPKPAEMGKQFAQAMMQQAKAAFELMQQNLAKLIERGIANEAAGGVSQGDGLDALVAQILPIIMQIILNGVGGNGGMIGQLEQLDFSSVYSQVGGSYGSGGSGGQSFSQWAGNDIFAAAGFDFKPLAESLADPIALSLVSGVGFSGYDRAIGNLATIGWDGSGQLDPSTINLARQLDPVSAGYLGALRSQGFDFPLNQTVVDAANQGDMLAAIGPVAPEFLPPTMTDVFYSPENLEAFNTANPEFVGPPAPTDLIGADAATAVDAGSSNIASNIGNAFEVAGGELASAMGNALVGGISGAVGSLVDGIPYVGGLLAPVAQRITALALVALLGPLGILVSGLPVEDAAVPGVSRTIGKTTQALIKPAYTTQGLNDQQVKQNTEALKKQEEIKDRIFRDCMQAKAAKSAIQALEEKAFVQDPAASRNSKQTLINKATEYAATSRQSGATSRTGEDQSVTTNLQQNLADARQEGYLLAAYRLRDIDAPGMSEMRQAVVRAGLGIAGPDYINGLTYSQQSLIWSIAERLAAERQAQEEKEFAVYGRNSKRECKGKLVQFSGYTICDGWWVVTEPGDLARAKDAAYSTLAINAALGADSYGEDQYLEQLFQHGNNWLSGNSLYGYSNAPLTIGEIFENGLADGLETGVGNLFNQASMSINQFENQLTSGFNSGGFYRSDFSNGGSLRFQDTVRNALSNTPGASALQAGQFNQLLQAIIAAIINAVLNQN